MCQSKMEMYEKEQQTMKNQLSEVMDMLKEHLGVKPPSEGQSHTIPSPKSVGHKFLANKTACYLLDWSGEVVAEGRWCSSDPNVMVHGIPLGHQFMRVWVDVAKTPGAYLFRPNHEMLTIGEAVGSTVAWPTEKVIARDANISKLHTSSLNLQP
ncbi:hypothetical protein UlMin_030802 [Ulmus minor]